MTTFALTPDSLPSPRLSRTARALQSLMSLLEHGEADADVESDEDLMVMLSGMVPDPVVDEEA